MNFHHLTVLRDEVADAIAPADGETYVDVTLGGGGHAEALLARAACRVIGLDRDAQALAAATERLAPFGDRFEAVHSRFSDFREALREVGCPRVHGLVADLGVSSPQLDQAERGFSFARSGPLDMRMDQAASVSAADIVNTWPEGELARVLFEYGEERQSRRIARAILAARPIADTAALAGIIAAAAPGERGRIHPATRSFQALRIAVNEELVELDRLLEGLPDCLLPGGRVAIISFHSLEDRRVKQFLAEESGRTDRRDPFGAPLRPARFSSPSRPILPSEDDPNPRARSARLRIAVRR
jgi:16S rRNA (cytosine1402-N4)-methyltransferase